MKRIFCILFLFCLLFLPNNQDTIFANNEKQVMVVQNQTNLYSSTDLESVVLCKINLKTILKVEDTIENNYTFYKVTYNNFTGFVYSNHCMDIANRSPNDYLDYNGKIISDNTKVYLSKNDTSLVSNFTLPKDTKIQILDGYDKNKDWTLISFIYEDISYIYYVKTNDIHADGISKTVIIIISIVITCISLILILFGVSFKKIKRKR